MGNAYGVQSMTESRPQSSWPWTKPKKQSNSRGKDSFYFIICSWSAEKHTKAEKVSTWQTVQKAISKMWNSPDEYMLQSKDVAPELKKIISNIILSVGWEKEKTEMWLQQPQQILVGRQLQEQQTASSNSRQTDIVAKSLLLWWQFLEVQRQPTPNPDTWDTPCSIK